MPSIAIRDVIIEDASVIAALLGELGYPSQPEGVRGRLARLLTREGSRVFVAERAATILGALALHRMPVLNSRSRPGCPGNRGDRGDFILDHLHLVHLDYLDILVYLSPLVFALGVTSLAAQSDPRPNECWGFVFGQWSPPLDWSGAGHASYRKHGAPPTPETATTDGAPRHDAVSFARMGGPELVLYPTWWPVGVGIALERQPAEGDTVRGIAHAFVADGRVTPPESRVLAWRTPCATPPAPPATRAAPDERRSLPAAPADARPRRSRAARPR